MTFDDYQRSAERTMVRAEGEQVIPTLHLAVMGLGLAGESGEVADLLKKWLGHGHQRDLAKLTSELGDVLWYVAAIATACGLTMDEVAIYNEAKLKNRYPAGFTHAASQGRAE
jgi:NTP pyrophosphatase (non-canonical NTP hydrolase)